VRTLYRWLNEDPDFLDELRETRARSLDHAATRLRTAFSKPSRRTPSWDTGRRYTGCRVCAVSRETSGSKSP
jgi:hypothetical protein